MTGKNKNSLKIGHYSTTGLSLSRNRRLAAKDILLDLAGGCFRQLGYEVNFLWRLEVRQMITSVIAQLGFRRGRACFIRRQIQRAYCRSLEAASLRSKNWAVAR